MLYYKNRIAVYLIAFAFETERQFRSNKSKKTLKKVLTIGMRGGIITKLSREAGANRSLKIEQQTRQDVQRKVLVKSFSIKT